jgi:hypothetical protein
MVRIIGDGGDNFNAPTGTISIGSGNKSFNTIWGAFHIIVTEFEKYKNMKICSLNHRYIVYQVVDARYE